MLIGTWYYKAKSDSENDFALKFVKDTGYESTIDTRYAYLYTITKCDSISKWKGYTINENFWWIHKNKSVYSSTDIYSIDTNKLSIIDLSRNKIITLYKRNYPFLTGIPVCSSTYFASTL
jgi:hypothetical protein